jgi:predicted DNA-binding transcriptional regulator AlpA
MKELKTVVSLSSTTIYEHISQDIFPIASKRGGASIWPSNVLEEYIGGKTDWVEYNNTIREERASNGK